VKNVGEAHALQLNNEIKRKEREKEEREGGERLS